MKSKVYVNQIVCIWFTPAISAASSSWIVGMHYKVNVLWYKDFV